MLGDTGGLNDAIHTIFAAFTGLIVSRSFAYSLTTKDFRVKKRPGNHDKTIHDFQRTRNPLSKEQAQSFIRTAGVTEILGSTFE